MSTPIPPLPAGLYYPNQDERTMATLAHALQLFGGWIAPLIIFFTKRESKFVSFHALQVLLFHLVYICVIMLCGVVFVFAVMIMALGAATSATAGHQTAAPFAFFLIFPFIWLAFIAGWILMLVTAIVFAIKANHGEWAELPIAGKWAKHILHI